jgi:hypothetical protein
MELTEEPATETELVDPDAVEEKPPVTAAVQGYAPESVNLVDQLSEQDQKALASEVVKGFERDWDSAEDFRERRDSIIRLYLGIMPALEDGEFRTQIHYAIIATAVQRMQARVYDQQFPSNGEYFGVKPTDANDLERSIRVAKHLNWQVQHQIPEYVPNHDILIQQWLLYGSAFSYVYWDPSKNRPCHEACRTEDIVISYTERSNDPSLGDVARITRILRKYKHELERMEDEGYYSNIDKVFKVKGDDDSNTLQSDTPIQETMDRESGMEKPDHDPDAPRKLLEQHRWYKLPGEKRQRPVVATVDMLSRQLVCLKLREDEDPEDRARFNREKAANKAAYDMAMEEYAMNLQAYQANLTQLPMAGPETMTAPPLPGEQTMTAPPMMGETTASMPMEPPPAPPLPPEEPAPPKMVPINFFTHYICIPNPEGFYGFGIGSMLEGNNIVADTIASQVVDAGTLANTSTFIYSRQAKLGKGQLKIRPGEGVETDLSPSEIKDGFRFLEFRPPDAALASFIKDQKEEAAELSGANDILSGEVGGSNETATTTQIRISQALAAIAIINKRYTRSRTIEGQKFARMNSVHLGDVEYFSVVDPFKSQPMQPGPGGPMDVPPSVPPPTLGPAAPYVEKLQVGRMDYLEDVDITITADPRMASQPQRFQEAMKAFELINASPFLSQMAPLQIAAAREVFIAMDKPSLVAGLEQGMQMMAMMPPTPPPGAPGAPPPEGGPPQPEDPGTAVPNAGPTPANGEFMSQGA